MEDGQGIDGGRNQSNNRIVMTNIEILCWGMKHIAGNHGLKVNLNWKEEGEVCIYGGCNIPTQCDVEMLCADLGIDKENIESGECGIDVWIPSLKWCGKEYRGGLEMWRRR